MSDATTPCSTVNFGSVGESGFQSVVSHVVSGPTSKVMVVRTVRSSLCPNTGVIAILIANGTTIAHGEITSVGSSIQAEAAPGTRLTAVVHTFPLNNGVVCTRLGELEYQLRECQLEGLAAVASAGGDSTIEVEAQSAGDAATRAFGEVGADIRTGFTSHFNFDNRVFPNDPHPPTRNKYRCLVECRLVGGFPRWYTNGDLATVHVGELDVLDINSRRVQVTHCRFWWQLDPHGQWHASDWVAADPGNHIVYAFLVWHGNNEYERPIYLYQEPNN